ncbi:MAG: heme o synthase, partial [Shimia sp.]
MWYDADIDSVMRRTAKRPIPAGRVERSEALTVGLALSGLSVVFLWLTTNLLAAALLAFTIFFYAVVYSMWLKRSTPQNIVIGGAAGAFPPMIGWVAVTGSISVEAVLMFSLIFLWTPPHFWALALFMRSDYDDAGVPMLTVTHGRRATRTHILAYTLILAAFALGAAFTGIGGWIYGAVALITNTIFAVDAYRIWRRDEDASERDNFAIEKRFFKFSLLYLALHFCAIFVETLV